MRINKYFIQIGVVILVVISYIYIISQLEYANKKIYTLESDKIGLREGMKVLYNENNQLTYQVKGLHITQKELKKYNSDLEKKIKDNNIKFKNLDAVIETQQNLIVTLRSKLKDSVRVKIVNDTVVIDTIKCFDYTDNYNTITGCIEDDSVSATFSAITPLTILVENVYKHKFLWWQWKVINRNVTVTSDNPSVKITDLQLYIPN